MDLPDDISVERRGDAYAVLRNKHEELGRIVVNGTPGGNTKLEPHVNEPQEENTKIVAIVMQQMTDALVMHEAQKPEHLRREITEPVDIPEGTELFETQFIPCSKCNKPLAKLVFSWESASADEMEIVGKKFELEASVTDQPMWILGAPDSMDDDIAKHLTLQVSPQKGEVYWEHPNEMNERLMALDENHC